MRLKEFAITRYGPLSNTGRISLHSFDLFWGRNEDGKTLTIDALVKLLVGRNIRDFDRIDRVEEKPEGYVIVEDDKGNEIKLPERGDLAKVAGLTSSECRSIFIIRNSDLSIASESEFFADVTHRLTGLRTDEISKIKDALGELGKMTESGVFRDIKDEKLKTRIERAKQLVEAIAILAGKIEEEGFDDLERESVRLQEEIERIAQDLGNLDDARKREEYEKGKEALDRLTSALEKVKGLEIYSESDRQSWRDCEKRVENCDARKQDCLANLQEKMQQLQETSDRLRNLEGEFRTSDERKRKLEEVKPELRNYEMGVGKLKSEETKSELYGVAAIISAVLLAVSILMVMLSPAPVSYGLAALFLTSTLISAMLRFSFTQKKAHLAAVFERLRLNVARFELQAESPEKLHSNIQKFEEEHQRKLEHLQDVKRDKERLEEEISKLHSRELPGIEKEITDAEKTIQEIRARSKVEFLREYAEKLESKSNLVASIQELRSVLRSHFGEKGKALNENVLHWSKEVQRFEEYKDKATGTKYSETAASELGARRREYEANLKEIKDKIGLLRKEMERVERDARDILKLEDPLYCETSVDLKMIEAMLHRFIAGNENNRDNALKAREIFEEIGRDEKTKVSELFGSQSAISRCFSEITNGLYEEVLFDPETGGIHVKPRNGEMLAAEKLSGGAYDQLYLSIRLALGEKLLKGRKGFFIMDDPLVKADPDRLQRQIQTLRKISESGWQVMYFSAKGEIKDALQEDIRAGTVNCIEIQRICS